MKTILTFSFVLTLVFGLVAFLPKKPTAEPARIQWLTIEEAYAKNQKEPRKFLIDVYTDWCGWCKVMDRETFTDPKVVDYVTKHYYAVKLDAEGQKAITLGPNTFKFIPQGNRGYQELAAILMNGKMSFPTVVFMDEKFIQGNQAHVIQAVPGYHKANEFHQIITFFGDDYYKKNTPWETYLKDIYPTLYK
ncbi:MAG: DUF255 domain-containing protein [Siphonobacter sp.]